MIKGKYDIDELTSEMLDGSISEDDMTTLKTLCREEDVRSYVKQICDIWYSSDIVMDKTSFDAKKSFAHLKSRIKEDQNKHQHAWLITMWNRIAVAAAVVLIVVLGGTFLFTNKQNMNFCETSSEYVKVSSDGLKKMNLPDGTQVVLNSGSCISYAKDMTHTGRKVTLSGEGYFKVKHDASAPFSVKTTDFTVNDLGTEFFFSNYNEDSEATVYLLSGAVTLHAENGKFHDITLHPGQAVVFDKKNGHLKILDNKYYNTDFSEMTFDNTRLCDIANNLSRNYKVRIEVASGVANSRFSGKYNKSTSTLDQILQTMSLTNHVKYKKGEGKYFLY